MSNKLDIPTLDKDLSETIWSSYWQLGGMSVLFVVNSAIFMSNGRYFIAGIGSVATYFVAVNVIKLRNFNKALANYLAKENKDE